jgi:hypothetical protein
VRGGGGALQHVPVDELPGEPDPDPDPGLGGGGRGGGDEIVEGRSRWGSGLSTQMRAIGSATAAGLGFAALAALARPAIRSAAARGVTADSGKSPSGDTASGTIDVGRSFVGIETSATVEERGVGRSVCEPR